MSSDASLSCRHSWLRTQYRSTIECLRGLCRDESGNALILLAISVVPLLALVGSSIDLGRAYLVESRLQQACDAGVLGARKELGAIVDFDPDIDGAAVVSKGTRFFNGTVRNFVCGRA